jgi:hypothetical protein
MFVLAFLIAIITAAVFYSLFGGRKVVTALADAVKAATPPGTIKFDLVGTFDPQLPTIIVITGQSGPKRTDYTNFRQFSTRHNLLFVDLDPVELQTLDLKHLACTKLNDAVRMLHANPNALQNLKSLGVDLKTCHIVVDDVSLFMYAKRTEDSPVVETTFPGPFVKWILAKTAFKNMLWVLASLLGSFQAKYVCCIAYCALVDGTPTFIQKYVMVVLDTPVDDGFIDNQATLAEESIHSMFMNEGHCPAELDKASFLDKIRKRRISKFTPEERFCLTARGLAYQSMIKLLLK